jgi:hypothetical protein
MNDNKESEFDVPFTVNGKWKVVVNPETACSKHPMNSMLVAEHEDGLGIYADDQPSGDRYWMRMPGDVRGPLTVVGCPPFGEVIEMADRHWPFQEKGSADA